jgi:predicted transcriptional regulator
MAATVRISKETHRVLRELAQHEDTSLQAILERAIETYRRQRFLDEANRQFASLRADDDAWQAELNERSEWDNTMKHEPDRD